MVCRVLQLCLKGLLTRQKKKKKKVGGGLKLDARNTVKLRSPMAMLIKTPWREGGEENNPTPSADAGWLARERQARGWLG